MNVHLPTLLACTLLVSPTVGPAATPTISGELKQWHKVTLTLDGPQAAESDTDPNPFLDYRFTVRFKHESGAPAYQVPGYFAADGNAAETSATSGNQWRAHLSPDKPGKWTYEVSFVRGPGAAVASAGGEPVTGVDGILGSFIVHPTDKTGRDFRAHGRLEHVGQRYLRFAGSGRYFLKAGPDSPENLLAYADFDGTTPAKAGSPARPGEAAPGTLKTWQPHLRDWREGDPTWQNRKGKGLIGALNYLAGAGCNVFSFLTYNAGGDGNDVWPFVARDQKLHYDCSKLDQWQRVFDHATNLGLYCHFKTQETEMDDLKGPGAAQSLDGGDLGPERRLYYRELIARFGHLLALNWNLGEENTQTPEQQRAATRYFHDLDPYRHLVVIHTYPDQQDAVYSPLLGERSALTGASLQNAWNAAHQRTLKWIQESAQTGRPWVVANDEQGPASLGVPPDPAYQGFSGLAREEAGDPAYDLHDIRKLTLWGTLMAGGQGVEYYFGYTLPENDLRCQDFRSREQSWKFCRLALEFFQHHAVPFWEMTSADHLVGNPKSDNSRYALAKAGEVYVVYLPSAAAGCELDLSGTTGQFSVSWYNPREGGPLRIGSVPHVTSGARASLGSPPAEPDRDWALLVRKR